MQSSKKRNENQVLLYAEYRISLGKHEKRLKKEREIKKVIKKKKDAQKRAVAGVQERKLN